MRRTGRRRLHGLLAVDANLLPGPFRNSQSLPATPRSRCLPPRSRPPRRRPERAPRLGELPVTPRGLSRRRGCLAPALPRPAPCPLLQRRGELWGNRGRDAVPSLLPGPCFVSKPAGRPAVGEPGRSGRAAAGRPAGRGPGVFGRPRWAAWGVAARGARAHCEGRPTVGLGPRPGPGAAASEMFASRRQWPARRQ